MADFPLGASVALSVPPAAKLVGQGEVGALTESLRGMLNDPKYSDVQFICKGGGRVHACRLLLVARSDVLKSLLTNGMVESKINEIPLPDITSLSMLTTVEFLYTGEILQNKLTLLSAFQTVHASRFLMLDKLEEYVTHVLVAAVKEVSDADSSLLAWCFTQFAELRSGNDGVLEDVHYCMASKLQAHVDSYSFNNLSIRAMNHYLDATQSTNTSMTSFREYLRLRSILLWACSKVSLQAVKVLRARLPDEKYLRGEGAFAGLKKCQTFTFSADADDVSPQSLEPGVVGKLQAWIEKLDLGWASVVVQCIHPEILVKILEPLEVIPPELYFGALRFQALRAGNMNVLKWDEPDKEYAIKVQIEVNGAVLTVHGDPFPEHRYNSHVRANMAINRGVFEWDIITLAPAADCMLSIGIHAAASSTSQERPLFQFLCNYGTLHAYVGNSLQASKPYCKRFAQFLGTVSKVRVHVDMKLRTCAFTVDGQYCGVAFSNLPQEVYPAVMGTRGAKFCIQLVSDADLL